MPANTDRRRLLGAGALIAGAATVTAASRVSAQETEGTAWKAAREEQDNWLDKPGTRHRMIFDTVTTAAVPDALQYAGNYVRVNADAYGVTSDKLSVIVVLRHFSVVYGFANAVWARYGEIIGGFLELDGDTSVNAMLKPGANGAPSTMTRLAEDEGVQYALCSSATRGMAMRIAREAEEEADEVEAFLRANAVPGGRFVPAGVVAIDRAQQRGYSFSYVQG